MPNNSSLITAQATDRLSTFDITLLEPIDPICVVLFAVGRGGNPGRHLAFLKAVSMRGCRVIAPHFEMLTSIIPTQTELDLRIRRLEAALDTYAQPGQPIIAIGHSIGAAALLALAGGEGETRTGQRLVSGSKWTFKRLALLAPAADFFRRPGALRDVRVNTRIWAGAQDTITPPEQAWFLKQALEGQAPADVNIDEHAGHFTFMDTPPPQYPEPHPDRRAFLSALIENVSAFILA